MNEILRRKIASGTAPGTDGSPGADHGWRVAFARAARDGAGLMVAVSTLRLSRRSLAEVLELPPDKALIALVDGPGGGLGMIALSPATLSALIESQTIGRVPATPPPARKPTRTDAAMVSGVIDRALSGLDTALADEADLVWAGGFRYASFVEDPRALGLLLEDQPFKVLVAEVDLGEAGRRGEVLLVLPAEGRGRKPPPRPKAAGEAKPPPGPVFSVALGEAVMGASATLEAVIARIVLPLRDVMALEVDQILPLHGAGLEEITLQGMDGGAMARGRLGQQGGARALRLTGIGAPRNPATAVTLPVLSDPPPQAPGLMATG